MCACVCLANSVIVLPIWPREAPLQGGKTHQQDHKFEGSLFFKVKCNVWASGRLQCRSPTFPVAAKLAGPPPGKQEGTFSPKWNIWRPKWVRQCCISPLGLSEPPGRVGTLGPAPAGIQDAPSQWKALAAAAAPGHLLAMQTLGSHPGLPIQMHWGRGGETSPRHAGPLGGSRYTPSRVCDLLVSRAGRE